MELIRVRNSPQAQRETAFHFLISNRFGFLLDVPAPVELSPAGTIGTSVSGDAIEFLSFEEFTDFSKLFRSTLAGKFCKLRDLSKEKLMGLGLV